MSRYSGTLRLLKKVYYHLVNVYVVPCVFLINAIHANFVFTYLVNNGIVINIKTIPLTSLIVQKIMIIDLYD